MLTEFKIMLICEKEFYNINMGSLFHGVIMELVGAEYAEKLHNDTLKPFSQSIFGTEEGILWKVCGLNKEFAEKFRAAIENTTEIHLKDKDKILKIKEYTVKIISYKEFINANYLNGNTDYFTVYFNTPASYKQNGRYLNYPDLSNIYSNIIRKFDAFSDEFAVYDEQVLEDMINHSSIVSYNLRSTKYSLESVQIPSFVGRIGIKVRGTVQLQNLINMILKYGEYSGAGIKTAMGMGSVKVIDRKRGNINGN